MKLIMGYGSTQHSRYLDEKEEEHLDLIKQSLNSGYRFIDTAQCYGKAESLIGKAIKRLNRKSFCIISKFDASRLNYTEIIETAKESYNKLNTYIDFFLIHYYSDEINLNEAFDALEKLKEMKIINEFGVSNFPKNKLEEASKMSKISAVQYEYSLRYQFNRDIIKFCKENDITFFAHKPLNSGNLLDNESILKLKPYAEKYNTDEASIALMWVIKHGTIPIIGSLNKKHIESNMNMNFNISKEDMIKIGNEFKEFRR